jgi:hypothetical protein
LYEKPNIPGSTPAVIEIEPSSGPDDMPTEKIISRGSLDLKLFLEHMLNDPSTGSGGAPEQLGITNTLRVQGDLQAGDDTIGTSKNNAVLSGKAAGKNRISISSVRLGRNLLLEISEFQASKANFEMLGKPGETGQIKANITLAVTGLGSGPDTSGHLKFTVTLTLVKGEVRDIKFGNVSLASASALRARPAPPKEK